MIAAHFAGFKALLAADSTLTIEDTFKLDFAGHLARETYVIIYGGGPDELDDGRLTAPQLADSDAEFVYTVRSVAPTADGARKTATAAFADLVGIVPTVTGRTCRRIRHTRATAVEADDTVKPPMFFIDDEYTLNSSRA